MRLLSQPNCWSCVPTSLAMVAGVSVEKIIELTGHDGSAIVFPHYTDPQRRQSFNIVEMNFVAMRLGIALVEFMDFYFEPYGLNKGGVAYKVEPYFEPLLKDHNAILIGEGHNGASHAVAWNAKRQLIYDPSGSRYSRDLFKIISLHVAVPYSVQIGEKVREEA